MKPKVPIGDCMYCGEPVFGKSGVYGRVAHKSFSECFRLLKEKKEKSMYVYIQSESDLWTVGFYAPNGAWHSDSDHSNREEAAKRVHWLNGGKTESDDIDEGGSLSEYKNRYPNQQLTLDV